MELVYSLNDLETVARKIIDELNSKTLLIYGNMGVGKTTLIKAIVKILDSKDEVSSPTFSIVNEYELVNGKVFHFDLYRIKNIEEALNFGIEEYFFSDNWSIIEWPDVIEDLLPEHFDIITIKLNSDNTRTLKINTLVN